MSWTAFLVSIAASSLAAAVCLLRDVKEAKDKVLELEKEVRRLEEEVEVNRLMWIIMKSDHWKKQDTITVDEANDILEKEA